MSLTLQHPIATARTILNDLIPTAYPQADLLRYANDALDAIVVLSPHYFYTCGLITCVADSAIQSISFSDALSLVSIDRIVGGDTPTQADRDTLTAFVPGWMSEASGPAVHWMPLADSKTRFYLYPPAPSGQVLSVTYVRLPAEYAETDDTELPVTLSGAIADYIAYLTLTRQDEYTDLAKAQAFMSTFMSRLTGKAPAFQRPTA